MEAFAPDLEVTYKGHVQIIKFNRPRKKNAFGEKIYSGLPKALALAAENDNVAITILTSTGEYFSSGNDLSQAIPEGIDDFEKAMKAKVQSVKDFVASLIDYPKILIAVINGPAIGIAVTMLCLCDVVYASETATFQTPFTSLGMSAEGCSTYTFPLVMGPALAGQMLYFNYKMRAEEAKQCGFVAEVFSKPMLPKLMDRLVNFAELPMKSLLCTKKLIRDRDRSLLHKVNQEELTVLEERLKSDDCIEAIIKFSMKKNQGSKL